MGWGREKRARHLSPPQHVTWILHATCVDEVVVSRDVASALLIRPYLHGVRLSTLYSVIML